MISMNRKILYNSLGLYVYWGLLKRGTKTLNFQQSSNLPSSWYISYTFKIDDGWNDLRRFSMRVKNFCFISGEKCWSLVLQYLKKNFQNSLEDNSQRPSSILAYIFSQKRGFLQFNFFMRQYMLRQSLCLMRLKLLLTKSNALETHAWVFQSCSYCPSTSERYFNPSIISSYQRNSIFSKPSKISLGVSLFQCIFSVLSRKTSFLFEGFHLCLTRMGIERGKVSSVPGFRLGGRMRKRRSQVSNCLLQKEMRDWKPRIFLGGRKPKEKARGVWSAREREVKPWSFIIDLIQLQTVEGETSQGNSIYPSRTSIYMCHGLLFPIFSVVYLAPLLIIQKMGQNFHIISDMGKLTELKYKKRPIICEFYTDWCPPCKPTRTILEKELKESGGKFSLACINCDEAEELNIQYEIEGVPTVIALNCDDKLTIFDKVVGYDPKKLKEFLQKVKKEMIEPKN